MYALNGQNAWPPPGKSNATNARLFQRNIDDAASRNHTPVDNSPALMPEASDIEDDHRRAHFADLYRKSEAKIALLFADDGSYNDTAIAELERPVLAPTPEIPPATDHTPAQEPPRKKIRRAIDEDDYDDDEDEDGGPETESPSKAKGGDDTAVAALPTPSKSGSSPIHSATSPGGAGDKTNNEGSQQSHPKTIEDARKKLEEARTATEEEVRKSFHTLFYTLENDRTAMIEQQQLEESEKQLQAEMDNNNKSGNANDANAQNGHGSLSSANLGASSLTLKHLIARIDMKRDQVRASDAELRLLMNEVRKNRSKWASEENVNQEDLYEALEKVLTELKAHTEYSTPFLTRVNKRDAPDYYNFIKQPMDLGSMTKKLKSLTYKSKADFVADLNLIWDNCLRYNQDMSHPLRRMANGMRREAEKLIPLIPDLTIRSRAEVEAEERRKQNGGDDDAGEDSDDEPIMSSRGRKAAGAKGSNKSRKTQTNQKEGTPDQKPILQLNGLLAKQGREGSEVDGSNGFATPIGGSATPSGLNGHSGGAGSNVDAMDLDGPSLNEMALGEALGEAAAQAYEDEEYKVWKQVTKKDRALVAKERHTLFKDNCLNLEAPALLRSKAGMRRFLKGEKQADAHGIPNASQADPSAPSANEHNTNGETLADELEGEDMRVIPDYYQPQSIVPAVTPTLHWSEDGDGQVINHHEWSLSLVPPDYFKAPVSQFTKKMDSNLRQIQETRRLATKISVIKQMQIQTQIYANQFPRTNYEPFVEADVEQHFVSDQGPVMAPDTCQDALKRSVGKVLYQAGFEELQPAAVDTLTNVAADYFQKIIRTFNLYREAERKPVPGSEEVRSQPRFTPEEVLLHTLEESGCSVASLEAYASDDVNRLGTKLGSIHDRMKSHLADLLRPALRNDAGADGAGEFKDGSEQFVSGDFAEEIGEDFFGFRSLGLESELGLDTLSVPLHLLQSRVRRQFQQSQVPGVTLADLLEALPPPEPVTKENIQGQIGLAKNFFLAKLHANSDQPLLEDEDLPPKQRRPRPRLGATGKISSPQKRPLKEQIALARKKKKLEAQMAEGKIGLNGSPEKGGAKKLKNIPNLNGVGPNPAVLALGAPMERMNSVQSQGGASQTDKDEANGMMSPESIDR
ncbi:related to transcription regulator SPT7 [Cephalotrichum gorgonifer]|uniref:SAGA complex subunit Spt7 n=1 Tax=Cephalotrichum gorgonifer TaxID=2041049 RepID=A0AAE8SX49_9PEZI|nr:related to transcription regulator SPT7 [Cephalotrichum gorgonifer]